MRCAERSTARLGDRILATVRYLQRLLLTELGENVSPKIYPGETGLAEREKWLAEWAKELAHLRACRAHAKV